MTALAGRIAFEDLRSHLLPAAALHRDLFARSWSEDALQDLLSVTGTEGFAAFGREEIRRFAGFVLFRASGDFAEILTLAVAPGFRRLGIGRALMGEALREVARMGAERLILEVQDGNQSAISLYESVGMTRFDRRKNYYKLPDGSHADAIMMQFHLPS